MDIAAAPLAMVAGEASGDLLAGLLLGGLHERWPALQAVGIGGPKMVEQGFQAWWPHHKLAVTGYVDVLRHVREIAGIRSALCERLLSRRPIGFIGVEDPHAAGVVSVVVGNQHRIDAHYIPSGERKSFLDLNSTDPIVEQ